MENGGIFGLGKNVKISVRADNNVGKLRWSAEKAKTRQIGYGALPMGFLTLRHFLWTFRKMQMQGKIELFCEM